VPSSVSISVELQPTGCVDAASNTHCVTAPTRLTATIDALLPSSLTGTSSSTNAILDSWRSLLHAYDDVPSQYVTVPHGLFALSSSFHVSCYALQCVPAY